MINKNSLISVAFFTLTITTMVQGENNIRGGSAGLDNLGNTTTISHRLLEESEDNTLDTDFTSDGLPPVDCTQFDRLALLEGVELRHGRPTVFHSWRKDDIRLKCSSFNQDHVNSVHDRRTLSNLWSPFASEEEGQVVDHERINPRKGYFSSNLRPLYGRLCGEDEFMTGITCDGDYCDNISIRCTRIRGRRQEGNIVGWTNWYTEGKVDIGGDGDRAIAGFKCRGSYCSEISFYWVRFCESC